METWYTCIEPNCMNHYCLLLLCLVAQSDLIPCDPMDCSSPGFSGHGTSQAGILEWVAISSSRGSSRRHNHSNPHFSIHYLQAGFRVVHCHGFSFPHEDAARIPCHTLGVSERARRGEGCTASKWQNQDPAL